MKKQSIKVLLAAILLSSICTLTAFGGWKQSAHGSWTYYYEDGTMAVNTIISDNVNSYYVDNRGIMATNQWVSQNEIYYYAGNDGAFFKDTLTPDGYVVTKDGALLENNINLYDVPYDSPEALRALNTTNPYFNPWLDKYNNQETELISALTDLENFDFVRTTTALNNMKSFSALPFTTSNNYLYRHMAITVEIGRISTVYYAAGALEAIKNNDLEALQNAYENLLKVLNVKKDSMQTLYDYEILIGNSAH